MASYDPPWYDDVRMLWVRPGEFFPMADQSDDERLNSVVRLVAYSTVAAAFVRGSPRALVFGAAAIAFLSLCFRVGRKVGLVSDGYARSRLDTVARRPQRCSPPTLDNPFMNATVGALMADPARPPACAYDDVEDEVTKGFENGLFKDLDDVYDARSGQRQFTVMPVTTAAPDTMAFAEYAFGARGPHEATCKEETARCGRM